MATISNSSVWFVRGFLTFLPFKIVIVESSSTSLDKLDVYLSLYHYNMRFLIGSSILKALSDVEGFVYHLVLYVNGNNLFLFAQGYFYVVPHQCCQP